MRTNNRFVQAVGIAAIAGIAFLAISWGLGALSRILQTVVYSVQFVLLPYSWQCAIELRWNAIDDTIRRFNADQEVATEYGAYGVAALIMPRLTNLTIIERSVKGKGFGFDFWLGSMDDLDTLFQRKARLEVSGIRKGSKTIMQSRVNMKLKQISPSDTVAPGYVAVVEFGTPRARVVKKCRT